MISTYQPNKRKKAKKHGFFARKATKILKNRRALGLSVNESTLSELYLYNVDLIKAYKSGKIVPKVRCEHCRRLTNGINTLDHN